MDDIEPADSASPDIIHVVSYSEGAFLATPPVVNESTRITRAALHAWRVLRTKGDVPDMARDADVLTRTRRLTEEARVLLAAIDTTVVAPCSAKGLYDIFRAGYLAAPHLWECRREFRHAVRWRTRVVSGAVKVVDEVGREISAAERAEEASYHYRNEVTSRAG